MWKPLVLVFCFLATLDQGTCLTPFGYPKPMEHRNGFQGFKPLFTSHFFGNMSPLQVEKPPEADVEPLVKTIEEKHPEIPLRKLFRFRPLRQIFIGKRANKN